jgi:EpsI family protein
VVTLGSALLFSGRRLAGELLLPLLFLAFAIPLPAALTNQLIYPLQLSSAVHTVWLLHAFGITALREGDVIYLTDSFFQIIETCSGLRSIFVLTTLAVGWVCFFPTRRLSAVLLILSAPLIAYLVNVLRILSLVLNPGSALASMHALQGLGVFLAGFLILYAVDSLLRRTLGGDEARIGGPETDPPLRPARNRHGSAIALASALAIMLGVSIWGPRWGAPDPPHRPSVELPQEIDGWRKTGKLKRPDRDFLGSVGFRRSWHVEYERGREAVSVFIGYDDRLDRSRSLLSPKNAVPDAGWHVEERGPVQLGPSGLPAESASARSGTTRTLNFHWYEGTDPLALEILRALLATDQSLLRRPGGAWVVRLTTELAQIGDGKAGAEARLRGFAELLGPRTERRPARKTTPRRRGPGRSGS